MRKRPLILSGLALCFLLIAVSFPLQIMWLYGHRIGELAAVLHKLTWLNWLVIGGLTWIAFDVYQASGRLRFAIPALIVLVGLNNFFVGYHGTDYSGWSAGFATLAFAALNLPLYRTDVRTLIEQPAKRWWRIATRVPIHMPVTLNGQKDQRLRGETFDVSETGLFFPLRDDSAGLMENQKVAICLSLTTFSQLKCDGRIVRRAQPRGGYPSGFGIEFVGLSPEQRSDLKRAIYSK